MTKKRLNVVVAGSTGYVGLDLVFLLSKHKNINIINLCAQKKIGKKISFFDKRITKNLPSISNLNNVKWENIDLLFLSLPNGEAQKIVSKLYDKYKHLKFIDLSADFRLNDNEIYKKWYKIKHNAKKLINKSVYSIPELEFEDIKNYRIISNPGCYPTSIQLALIPLLKKNLINTKNIIIDSKSGYSGAGKNFKYKFKEKNLFLSTIAYSVSKHRHMAEIDQQLKTITKKDIFYTFNPHVMPTYRGILTSIYVETKKNISINILNSTLKKFYKNKSFINIGKINKPIGTGHVLNTNNCSISIAQTRYKNKFVIFSALDNLIKGASGQAIQNMNVLYNLKETSGLK
tara:strand:- start:1113 stop:2147 length:1035 start_codon:yes stop_codon:yes gene_type:complete